jgi:glycerophosphoryl diester phosphodiesterase
VPSLEQVLILCKDRIFVNIEIKDPQIVIATEKVIELITKLGCMNQIAISSFKLEYFNQIQRIQDAKEIEFGFLYDTTEGQKVEFGLHFPNNTINVHYKEVNIELVEAAHKKGMGIQCWFCMNDVEDYETISYLIRCNVDVICCNDPINSLKIRDQLIAEDLEMFNLKHGNNERVLTTFLESSNFRLDGETEQLTEKEESFELSVI